MTPQEEQAAMQAFVRQRLAAQGQQQQLNLAPGQVPLAPEDQGQFLQRPPIAPGVREPLSGAENSEIARDAGPSPTQPGGLAIGVPPSGGPPAPLGGPTQGELPVALTGGGYSMGKRLGQTSQPLSVQGGYNLPDLPIGVSGGTSLRPGRGLGGVDLRAYFRQPF